MLLYCGVVVAQKTVSFLPPDMVRGVLKASGGQLYDADGARVVLVADPYAKLQSESPGFPKNIVCIDDSLLGNAVVMDGGDSFARILESILNSAAQGKTAASAITVRHIPWFAEDKPQNEVTAVYRLARLPAVDLEADSLVILSIGLPDLHDRLSAVDYEKHLQFIVDYLWCVRRAQVLLVTLPPVPADAEMSRAFAKKTVQVGLEKGVPVFDLYTAMRVRPDWRDFFRDTDTQQGAFFLYPNRRGQHWIAEELARLILQWKTRPATGS